jgi:hypothetical protein
MKKLFLLTLIIGLILTSCKKEEFVPMEQVPEEEYTDSTAWQDTYSNGGTLPGGGTGQDNPLIGTTWVLTKYVSAFATEYPNDTITFTGNDDYVLNQNAVRPYSLALITSSTNYELTFNYFYPFGGSHYSGQVGYYFVDDGELNNIEFTDVQNTSSTIRAWFTKIN